MTGEFREFSPNGGTPPPLWEPLVKIECEKDIFHFLVFFGVFLVYVYWQNLLDSMKMPIHHYSLCFFAECFRQEYCTSFAL